MLSWVGADGDVGGSTLLDCSISLGCKVWPQKKIKRKSALELKCVSHECNENSRREITNFRMFWLSLFIFLNIYSFNLNSKLHNEFLTREHWCKGAGFMLLFTNL